MATNRELTLQDVLDQMNAGFQRLEKKFDGRFDDIDKRFEQVDRRFEQVHRRFEQVDRRFDEMLKNLGRYHRDHEQRIRKLEKAVFKR